MEFLMNNYELLGRPSGDSLVGIDQIMLENVEENTQYLYQTYSKGAYKALLQTYQRVLDYSHLGVDLSFNLSDTISTSAALSLEYLSGDRLANSEKVFIEKKQTNQRLIWFEIFQYGFLSALFDDNELRLNELANWVEGWMEAETFVTPFDPLWASVYIIIASEFRSRKIANLHELETRIEKSRTKAPKLGLKTWIAARSGNQTEFDSLFVSSLSHFEKIMGEQMFPWSGIGYHQTIILQAARRLGIALPTLTNVHRARVITIESLCLPSRNAWKR